MKEKRHIVSKYSLVLVMFVLLFTTNISSALAAQNSYALGSRYAEGQNMNDEIKEAEKVCNRIIYDSGQMGFTSYDWYGSSSTKSNILLAASGDVARNAISFYVGHGSDESYYIWADDGTEVWFNEVYRVTGNQITKFAFLWSCNQAEVKIHMPMGWLHTTSESDDGYHNPDCGKLTFISFKAGAPFLNKTISGVQKAGAKFVNITYDALASGSDVYVNEALDIASFNLWGVVWDQCQLYTDYSMWVYGDGYLSVCGLQG